MAVLRGSLNAAECFDFAGLIHVLPLPVCFKIAFFQLCELGDAFILVHVVVVCKYAFPIH